MQNLDTGIITFKAKKKNAGKNLLINNCFRLIINIKLNFFYLSLRLIVNEYWLICMFRFYRLFWCLKIDILWIKHSLKLNNFCSTKIIPCLFIFQLISTMCIIFKNENIKGGHWYKKFNTNLCNSYINGAHCENSFHPSLDTLSKMIYQKKCKRNSPLHRENDKKKNVVEYHH